MKNALIKNSKNHNLIVGTLAIQQMNSRMMHHCLLNGLVLNSTISYDERGVPAYSYALRYTEHGESIFSGTASTPDNAHYDAVLKAVTGEIVSELCPPAMRYDPMGTKISYWKRQLLVEQNITNYDAGPSEKNPGFIDKTRRETCWVGYGQKNEELFRVQEGVANPGWEEIERIQFIDLGPLGQVAAVVFRDATMKPGETASLGEAISMAERNHSFSFGEAAASTGFAEPMQVLTARHKSPAASMSDRFEDTMGTAATSDTPATTVPLSEKAKVDGIDISDIPAVMDRIAFREANNEQKSQYLGAIEKYRDLANDDKFVKENPEAMERISTFLCDVIESNIFESEYRSSYPRKIETGFDIPPKVPVVKVPTRTMFTAQTLGFTDNVMINLYGSVEPIQRNQESAEPAKIAEEKKPAPRRRAVKPEGAASEKEVKTEVKRIRKTAAKAPAKPKAPRDHFVQGPTAIREPAKPKAAVKKPAAK